MPDSHRSANVQTINWNRIQNAKGVEVEPPREQHPAPQGRAPNEVPSWSTLTPEEQQLITRVFTCLTLPDAIQNSVGAVSPLMPGGCSPCRD